MSQKLQRLNRTGTGLLVVDIQEKLLPHIFEKERLIRESVRLIKGVSILSLPIFVTEQYRKGLGLTPPEIASIINGFAPIEKDTFSACGAEGLLAGLKTKGIRDLLLCGMEAHICILNSCLDLLEAGFGVFVVADAVSARNPENTNLAFQRMREAGAVIVSIEMALFELLGGARTDEFKQVQALIK
jgi:nicotinamidase-related amidase